MTTIQPTGAEARKVARMSPAGTGKRTLRAAAQDEILALINARNLKPGDKLPSEGELVNLLGRSRDTVRRAIATLADLGIVDRVNGVGSFVAKRDTILVDASLMHDLDARQEAAKQTHDAFGSVIADAGYQPSSQFELIQVPAAADPGIAKLLGVGPKGAMVVRVVNRRVNGQPRNIESSYFHPDIARNPKLAAIAQPYDVQEGTTLLLARVYPNYCNENIFETRPPTLDENAFLNFSGPVLVHTIVMYDELGGKPIRVARFVYRGDLYRLRVFVPGRGNPPVPPEIVEVDGEL